MSALQSSIDPLGIAVKEIAETRRLLANLITSSESFDYHAAKLALGELEKKHRTLAKLHAKLLDESPARPADRTIIFGEFTQGAGVSGVNF
jgi:hypothetical protein